MPAVVTLANEPGTASCQIRSKANNYGSGRSSIRHPKHSHEEFILVLFLLLQSQGLILQMVHWYCCKPRLCIKCGCHPATLLIPKSYRLSLKFFIHSSKTSYPRCFHVHLGHELCNELVSDYGYCPKFETHRRIEPFCPSCSKLEYRAHRVVASHQVFSDY
jgi:hypothetical protein